MPVRGKHGKPTPGFPRFPPPLENPAEAAGFSHFHRPGVHRLEKWKTQNRFPTFPLGARDDDDGSLFSFESKNQKKGSRAAPRPPHSSYPPLSLWSSGTDFMLIFQLENAALRRGGYFRKAGRVAEFRPSLTSPGKRMD